MIRAVSTPMRLESREIETIRAAVREVFGDRATVRVFGSRARDALRGGDIDLFVEVDPGQASIANEQRLRDRIAPVVEDLRLDIVLHERGTPLTPIERIALRDGLLL
jgi:predicted nucleotidyltransferase